MKQRLVGALILLSGGVVLWSLLFTGPAAYKVNEATQIPPAPAVSQPEPITPVRPAAIAEVDEPEPLPEPPVPDLASSASDNTPDKPTVEANTAEKPAAKPEPVVSQAPEPEPKAAVAPKPASTATEASKASKKANTKASAAMPEAWVIQVASFSNSANAESLRKRLAAKGYDAFVKSVSTPGGKSMQRVFVGPELKKSQAERHKADIEKAFRLKALLHEYTP